MSPSATPRLRCAIYTRVSTEHGLDQEFNSLDAQHDAAQAYIRSQAHAGWTLVRGRYDDGGYSGGSTERPGLQQLLTDVKARRIDVIVVYKVDRLTRSLADFAKLVELFDAHGVSFVSVTQQFNTTSSMGRLTLNVLLSFAQFEREVIAERVRDKVAASKRKGFWVGGMVPLGYTSRDRKLVVVEDEAERVRLIFARYLELGSLKSLLADLLEKGIVTKVRMLSAGRTAGGIPFTRGPLAYLLRNRFYIGEVVYRGKVCPGEQLPILPRGLFEAVQARLTAQRAHYVRTRSGSEALLMGRIVDAKNNRMTPTHATKHGVRYRYYWSPPQANGGDQHAPSATRVPAAEVEALVLSALRSRIAPATEPDDRALIAAHVERVQIRADVIEITLQQPQADPLPAADFGEIGDADGPLRGASEDEADDGVSGDADLYDSRASEAAGTIRIPWRKQPSRLARQIIVPEGATGAKPPKAETRDKLIASIATGRRWLADIVAGKTSIEALAAQERCSERRITMMLSLAFLSPALVHAATDGRLPRGIGVSRLFDAPAEWERQHQMLGLPL